MTAIARSRLFLVLAGLNGALAMSGAALLAHGFSGTATAADWVEKASRYQLFHAVALVTVATQQRAGARFMAAAGVLFVGGLLFFCGGLYGLAFTPLPVVALVPVGGTCFILGWLAVATHAVLDR